MEQKIYAVTVHYPAPAPGDIGPEKVQKVAVRDDTGRLILGEPVTGSGGGVVLYQFYEPGANFGGGNNARQLWVDQGDLDAAEHIDLHVKF